MLGFSPFSSLPFSSLPPTNYSLSCSAGSYTVTGQAATLTYSAGNVNYSLSCANGTYNVTGQSATLTYVGAPHAYSLSCANGTYAVTGQSATLIYSAGHANYALSCAFGAYSVTGQTATLTYTPGSGPQAYTLSCANGNYFVTGQSALLNYSGSGPVWGSTGGIGKKHKEHVKRSARADLQEHIETLFADPVAQDLKEEVQEYVKPSQGLSIHSIDYGRLAQNAELVERILDRIKDIQQEQEDEALLLMLI